MRTTTILKKALFSKDGEHFSEISLPHTWNNLDGQDGGNDYHRGTGTYRIDLPAPQTGKRQYIQFEGANHVAKVSCNGQYVGCHAGGFSTFRFELTSFLKPEGNVMEVLVDNVAPEIYPQQADFTFFGGLYRNVSLIETEAAHFALNKDGTNGVFMTPKRDGETRVDVFLEGQSDGFVKLMIKDADGQVVASEEAPCDEHVVLECKLLHPHLWAGQKDAYLYRVEVVLEQNGSVHDKVEVRYGYRDFYVDAENGFYLNGEHYPLHGVSRHQDRENKGWAIGKEDHEEDMELIREIGANTIRLAHYQHDQYFYDLCDKAGMVVWAEIPFISRYMDSQNARQNALNQMRELVVQNYNHPSICFFGIGNEITLAGIESESLYQDLRELNALAKKLDPSRLTTMAHVSMITSKNAQAHITDVHGYNIYLGWYTGTVNDNGAFLDKIHRDNPKRPLALSEYGADALTTWHSAAPENHDYTEEYQAVYHEKLLQCFEDRPYLWATYVWNMFDFAADARDEGGCKGRNNKGLVTYDRKVKKDAFYIYQAHWTTEPMIHLCGKRFADRAPGERDVKVYTNGNEVTLKVNGNVVGTQEAARHQCIFKDVPLQDGENVITAVETAHGVEDTMVLNGVNEQNPMYRLPDDALIGGNWFDEETGEPLALEYPEGYHSIRDTLGELMDNPQAAAILEESMAKIWGQSAQPNQNGGNGAKETAPNPPDEDEMETHKLARSIGLQHLLKMAGAKLTPGDFVKLNRKLNQIKKTGNRK